MTATTRAGALGARLKQLMALRGLNQSMLAKKTGVERSVLNRIISGKARPKIEQLDWIAEVLDADVHELMRTADLASDLRYLFDQLCAAHERIRELERERDAALARVRDLDAERDRPRWGSRSAVTRDMSSTELYATADCPHEAGASRRSR